MCDSQSQGHQHLNELEFLENKGPLVTHLNYLARILEVDGQTASLCVGEVGGEGEADREESDVSMQSMLYRIQRYPDWHQILDSPILGS